MATFPHAADLSKWILPILWGNIIECKRGVSGTFKALSRRATWRLRLTSSSLSLHISRLNGLAPHGVNLYQARNVYC